MSSSASFASSNTTWARSLGLRRFRRVHPLFDAGYCTLGNLHGFLRQVMARLASQHIYEAATDFRNHIQLGYGALVLECRLPEARAVATRTSSLPPNSITWLSSRLVCAASKPLRVPVPGASSTSSST